VVDLGVMVPLDRILSERKADIIGVRSDHAVARRNGARRRKWSAEVTTPLLIGGATTSKQHTAVKVAPGTG
jgi:5-methyltetrahydrofolate--homocysteine methyltransferase